VALPPFRDVVDEHRALVWRFLAVAVGRDDVDDVAQETFLAALRAYPRCNDATHLDRWLLKIASRKAIDHHRRTARSPHAMAEVPEEPAARVPDGDDGLWAAVAGLPAKQRAAVVLRHVLDRPYDEIAWLLACSPDAARANVAAGLKRLREVIT